MLYFHINLLPCVLYNYLNYFYRKREKEFQTEVVNLKTKNMYDNDELIKTKQRLYKTKDNLDKAKQEIFKLKQEIKELQMGIIHKLPEGMHFNKLFLFYAQYFSKATGVIL